MIQVFKAQAGFRQAFRSPNFLSSGVYLNILASSPALVPLPGASGYLSRRALAENTPAGALSVEATFTDEPL